MRSMEVMMTYFYYYYYYCICKPSIALNPREKYQIISASVHL